MTILDRLRIPARRSPAEAISTAPSTGVDLMEPPQRILGADIDGNLQGFGSDLLGQQYNTALGRRQQRPNAEITEVYAAVFAAIRWREQAITRPQIVLQRKVGRDWEDVGDLEDPQHPALAAMLRINEATTFVQGWGGIERGKLQNGDHFWIKRRDGLGVPVEFEVWDGASARAMPRKDRPWVPSHFVRRLPDGREERVPPEDVIWFRHIVDLRDPMRSLTPISAVRLQVDTALEAQRWNQRIFDQGLGSGGTLVPGTDEEINEGELARIKQSMQQDWTGTDNAHRWHVLGANLKLLANPQTNRDLEFIGLMQWGVTEVARAFELSPITLKDFTRATYANVDGALAQDWDTIRNQENATIAELNEFYIRPDFGEEWRLQARYDKIPALQDDAKKAAEVDDLQLRSAYTTINELRERDGRDPVDWGDVPLMPLDITPLGTVPTVSTPAQLQEAVGAEEPQAPQEASLRAVVETPQTEGKPPLLSVEKLMSSGWAERFSAELRRLLAFIDEAVRTARGVEQIDVTLADWDWAARYTNPVTGELAAGFEAAFVGVVGTDVGPLVAQELATNWASSHAGSLITNITNTTRAGARDLVAKAVEEGWSTRRLKNEMRKDFLWGKERAEMIARTETASAVGQGQRGAARTQGRDEKLWQPAGPNPCPVCIGNGAEGWINIDRGFSGGSDTVPAHPRCVCDVEYRTARLQEPQASLPRKTTKTVQRDAEGRITAVVEEVA